MRSHLALRLVLLALLLARPTAALGDEGGFVPEDWRIAQGRWSFEPAGELTCKGQGMSSLIYYRREEPRDLDLQVQVMFLGPSSSAGLVFRGQGNRYYTDTTFYQLEWYTAGRHHPRRLSLMVKNPRWKQIVTPLLRDPPLHRWITLRVRAVGESIQAFVDGERVFEKREGTFLRPGRLGLHVFMPSAVRFRQLRLVAPPDSGA